MSLDQTKTTFSPTVGSTSQATDIEQATALFSEYIPPNTTISIEQYDSRCSYRYVIRLKYTSEKSGRTICMVAKGDRLPVQADDTMLFYLRQIVLTPKEISREFNRVYFLERRAKQDYFLSLGKLGNPRVVDETAAKDRFDKYGDYAPHDTLR